LAPARYSESDHTVGEGSGKKSAANGVKKCKVFNGVGEKEMPLKSKYRSGPPHQRCSRLTKLRVQVKRGKTPPGEKKVRKLSGFGGERALRDQIDEVGPREKPATL